MPESIVFEIEVPLRSPVVDRWEVLSAAMRAVDSDCGKLVETVDDGKLCNIGLEFTGRSKGKGGRR